jgi:recombinational DNA repair protein RecR
MSELNNEDLFLRKPYTAVKPLNTLWAHQQESKSECEYCKTLHRDDRCPSCGAPVTRKKKHPEILETNKLLQQIYAAYKV